MNPGDQLVAAVTITNFRLKPIVKTFVLIDTKRMHPPSGNRLFKFEARIAPGETRVIHGRVVDRYSYSLKDFTDQFGGCELDRTDFADGTTWELGSPL